MNYNKCYSEMGLKEIAPKGWIKQYLEKQKNGLTGHMENAGAPFNGKCWTDFSGKEYYNNWGPYEQTGYWIDGALRCGYLLDDKELTEKAKRNIDYVMSHPDKDGYLGPQSLKDPKLMGLWPHVVFFRAVMAEYRTTGNREILDKLIRHYKTREINIRSLREVCNLEILLFIYEETGDIEMLEIAREKYAEFERLYYKESLVKEEDLCYYDVTEKNLFSKKKSKMHGVSYNEVGKIPGILYMYTGDKELLKISKQFYKKIDMQHMLVNGVCSSSEMLNTTNSLDTCETCDTADYTWSLGYLLMADGDAKYADKIEKAIFNAAPGAVTEDFKALQYFSGPNQVICDYQSNHNKFFRGNSSMSYSPNPFTECCPGEVNRIMPNFASRMWMKKYDGIAAVFYGPSELTTTINGEEIKIKEITSYPFTEEINFEFSLRKDTKFSFDLRIPGWCTSPELFVNKKRINDKKIKNGKFYTLNRKYTNGDKITLKLPMELKTSKWPKNGIALERGPIVYSLGIIPDMQVDKINHQNKSTEEFPAWNMYPISNWNYALDIDNENFKNKIKIIFEKIISENPWSLENAPIKIKAPARKVDGWKLEKKLIAGRKPYYFDDEAVVKDYKENLILTPELPNADIINASKNNSIETITLVPYGCTNLRITIFPHF
jgi:uncharacterized protein